MARSAWPSARLPRELAISAITLAELAAVPQSTTAAHRCHALYTRNPDDFAGLSELLEIAAI